MKFLMFDRKDYALFLVLSLFGTSILFYGTNDCTILVTEKIEGKIPQYVTYEDAIKRC